MKFHRLTLRNYRGVEEATVELAEVGVTVIEGNNEVGKTSLAEAIHVIIEHPDSSNTQLVRAIQPAGKDLGAEIEIDASMGKYRFTYKKRFHRNRLTELQVHEPSPENLAGREAHDRVRQIFNETTDAALFRALWIQQGVALDQAKISDTGTLGAVLDKAAGREVAGESEYSLYSRVEEESMLYWTPGGQPNIEFLRRKRSSDAAESGVAQLADKLKALDDTVQLAASLQNEIDLLKPQEEQQRKRVNELEQAGDSIEEKERQLESLRLETERDAARLSEVKERLKARVDLNEKLQNAESALSELLPDWENLTPSFESAQNEFSEADRPWEPAKEAEEEATRLATLRQDDLDYYDNLLHRDLMRDRSEGIRQALQRLQQAEVFLETCQVDDSKLTEIEEAQASLHRAQARLEGEGAQLKFNSLSDQNLEINGQVRRVPADQEIEETITERFILRIPDVADITITPGSSARPSKIEVETATTQLKETLTRFGVATIEEARRLNRERATAEETRRGAKRTIEKDRRDLTVDQLETGLQSLESKTGTYLDQRIPLEPPIPKDREEAKELRNTARIEADQRRRDVSEIEERRSAAEEVLRQLANKKTALDVEKRTANDRASAAQMALDEAREAGSDTELQELLQTNQKKALKSEERYATEKKALEALNPESFRVEYETALGVEKRMGKKLDELVGDLQYTRALLQTEGEAGLQSQYDHAQSQLERTASSYRRFDERARGVQLLFETMKRHRAVARKAYLAPLRERIQAFGKIVFGPTLSVELGDDLQISRRTLDGVTLDFKELSIGAREQLGVLSRLACASIAAEDGGVPLILDDALGWSDIDRLRRIGAALTVGSKDCQVIALTCTVGRYQHVAAKKVIRLPTTG